IKGSAPLKAEQSDAHKRVIDKHSEVLGHNGATIEAAFDLVATYDAVVGPLWVKHGGFNRRGKAPANDIHFAVYTVMQNIMDRVYTTENLARYGHLLKGFKFGSSAHFPGAVEPPSDPNAAHTVKINGSYLKPFKHALMHEERPARRPTGAYLAPGTLATVKVPPSIVGKGYQVRVGAHCWDNARKPRMLRLDRSSLVYSIESPEVKVASPLGGGIYIEVPMKADAGIVEVTTRNAVRSPYFSAKPFHRTSLAEWRNVERKREAPWADFQSEKFMMQVPTSWIRKLDDPVTLMKNWDAAMDAMNDLMGLPRLWGKETMYLQVDLQNRSRVFAPGYPTVNDRYDPRKAYDGYVSHYLVRGPQLAPDYAFHEQGHAYLFVKFGGEMESTVNLLHVAVWNQKFGYSLDEAFAASRNMNKNEHRTLDNTAVTWMTSLSFAAKRPMAAGEKAYQLKGHAKFVDIARLFGWQALNGFWASWTADFEAGRPWSKHGTDIDKLSLRLSQKAGVDLTPLLHFWGTPPRDAAALKAAVAAEKLPPSAKVYDALMHYKALVPKGNQAFRDFALKWWGKQPSSKGYWTEREHTKQWDGFNEETSARIKRTVQEIIDLYFPDGRPKA
ncbi:MAG: hypothetical protein HQ546_03400, partial [Planctomycetes bacterium]|nr:hypothetical protein [Planctomycetota bacterium]